MNAILDFDLLLFQAFNGLGGQYAVFDWFIVFFAEAMMFLLGLGALVLFFMAKEAYRAQAKTMLISAYLGAFLGRIIMTPVLRMLFFRERPFLGDDANLLVYHNPLEGAFPSGHTVIMFALSFAVFKYSRKWGFVFFVLSFFSGMARVIAGIHYPFDILGGIIIGAISFLIARQILLQLRAH